MVTKAIVREQHLRGKDLQIKALNYVHILPLRQTSSTYLCNDLDFVHRNRPQSAGDKHLHSVAVFTPQERIF
ncbi:hypothetical protein WA026_012820, partial [Henosepilachna vigintioctopunctata]